MNSQAMQNRYWHGLDRFINPLGFGAWQIAGNYNSAGKPQGWGVISDKEALYLIDHAFNNGIHFFDTAKAYNNGKSEELIGKALASSAEKQSAVICTKIPLSDTEIKNNSLSRNFRENVEQSLKRLQRERIDVLLIHNPPDTINWIDFDSSILEKLQKLGKIATYGVSCRSIHGANKVLDSNFGTVIEWVFNLLERRPVNEIFPRIEQAKMNFIARSPLNRGLLASKYYKKTASFNNTDFRSGLPDSWVDWVYHSIRKLENNKEFSANLAQMAIKYCLYYEPMSVVIPGIRKKEHLEEFINAVKQERLDKNLIDYLDKVTESHYPPWT